MRPFLSILIGQERNAGWWKSSFVNLQRTDALGTSYLMVLQIRLTVVLAMEQEILWDLR